MLIAIIDYGSGNLRSAEKAFEHAARAHARAPQVRVTADPDVVAAADRIVLPGVGAFADCSRGLKAVDGMAEALIEAVEIKGRPFFGICVGMQLMASRGLEFETTEGFGWIPGDVTAITPDDPALKIPHMGWNTITVTKDHPVLNGIWTPARTGCTPISCIPITLPPAIPRMCLPPPTTAARSPRSSAATP
jgi:glutamine amidotransferase